ncbi:hypothetical protein F5Y07DRAFT_359891 [Xylaria sp. FL0933]|nr:hypothetical protein F5Y07DRAFT_359891 [Xylaria sp. FL0933]
MRPPSRLALRAVSLVSQSCHAFASDLQWRRVYMVDKALLGTKMRLDSRFLSLSGNASIKNVYGWIIRLCCIDNS